MTQNPDIIEHPSLTTSKVDFQNASLPFVKTSEDIWMDELWDIADATVAETRTPSLPSPLMLPAPMIPEDSVTWLKLAGKMAVEGRHEEAGACRKTAMDLMQQNR